MVSSISWDGELSDPINLSAQLSAANKNIVLNAISSFLSSTAVEFVFTIYDYDQIAKTYFKCFHTNKKTLYGTISKITQGLAIAITNEAGTEVANPENYRLDLGVTPLTTQQELYLALSTARKFNKVWGIEIGE